MLEKNPKNGTMTKNKKGAARKQYVCDDEVKKLFIKYSHKKCSCQSRRKAAVAVTGKFLNNYLLNHRDSATLPCAHFNARKKFNICSNLFDMINQSPQRYDEDRTPTLMSVVSIAPSNGRKTNCSVENPDDEKSRSQRLFLRNRVPANDSSLKGVKNVQVRVGNDKPYVIETENIRTSQRCKFKEDVLSHYYKVPFGKLKMNERRRRMAEIGKVIFGACINRKEFKKDSEDYLMHNKDLVIEMVNLLDGIKDYVQMKTKVKVEDLQSFAVAPPENDREGLIEELDCGKKEHKLAIALLGETTQRGFERIRTKLKENTDVSLPSFYRVTKNRAKIVPIEYNPVPDFDSEVNQVVEDVHAGEAPAVDGPVMFLDMDEMNAYPEEYQLELLLRRFSVEKTLVGAKIDGDYCDYVKMMIEKHRKKGRVLDDDGSGAVIIDSIDGAEHLKSKTKITSVISFSSSLFDPRWIQSREITAGSSLNILTWQQVRGTETIASMLPAVEDYFSSKKLLRESENNNHFYYELHDGKMLYLLTQHSQWSRKFHPFLLCKCGRGEGVRNNATHVCVPISHEEQITLYERSMRRWNLKRHRDPTYDTKKHLDWIDLSNSGISHFGLHPNLLPRDSIRFDMFHMKCAVTRKLMAFLRLLLLNQATDVIDNFLKNVLKKFWNDYHMYVWKNKKNFASFLGNEIALFVGNTKLIVNFLDSNLVQTDEVKNFIKGLKIWVRIFKFTSKTYIEDVDAIYLNKVETFERDLKNFYEVGSRTFLSTDGTTNGSQETFYCHVLRYYVPKIVRTTFNRHRLGIGIFTMQGFERRNKESKNCMKRFSNNKGNVIMNNMKRLHDVFEHEINAT